MGNPRYSSCHIANTGTPQAAIGQEAAFNLSRRLRDKKKFEGGQGDLNGFSYKLFGCPPDSRPAVFPVFGGVPNVGNITCREFIGFPDASNPLRYFPPGELQQDFNVFTPKLASSSRPRMT